MPDVNIWAVLLCGVAALVIGGVWYAPPVLGRRWQASVGLTDEQLASGNMPLIFGAAFVLSVLAAYVFALFLGQEMGVGAATAAGFAAGLFWVAGSLGIIYLFERRTLSLWLINSGYLVLLFTSFGLILGLLN